eukprot:gene9766-6849_t
MGMCDLFCGIDNTLASHQLIGTLFHFFFFFFCSCIKRASNDEIENNNHTNNNKNNYFLIIVIAKYQMAPSHPIIYVEKEKIIIKKTHNSHRPANTKSPTSVDLMREMMYIRLGTNYAQIFIRKKWGRSAGRTQYLKTVTVE